MTDTEISKVLGALGLARKAGKCAIGTDIIVDAMRKGSGKLLVIASDASDATIKKLTDTSSFHHVPRLTLDATKAVLAARLGKKSELSAALVTDDGFAKMIRNTKVTIIESL